MCGRYTLIAPFQEIIDRINAVSRSSEQTYQPCHNIAPGMRVLAVINDGQQNRVGYLRWGLIPPFAKSEKMGYKLINARAETLMERPSFRSAFLNRRCLIIADSFYEWIHDASGKTKQPMRIQLSSQPLFMMAGLWERWKSPDGETLYSCTIITTEANTLMAPIHNRMPVILRPEDEARWLDPTLHSAEMLQQMLCPFDPEQMTAYPVSQAVNSVKNDHPDLIQPLPEQPN